MSSNSRKTLMSPIVLDNNDSESVLGWRNIVDKKSTDWRRQKLHLDVTTHCDHFVWNWTCIVFAQEVRFPPEMKHVRRTNLIKCALSRWAVRHVEDGHFPRYKISSLAWFWFGDRKSSSIAVKYKSRIISTQQTFGAFCDEEKCRRNKFVVHSRARFHRVFCHLKTNSFKSLMKT